MQNGPRVSHTSEWSHLFADTEDELHAFAGRLGLRRSYFQQGKPDWFPHYDVTRGMRFKALRLGAEPVSARDAAVIARERNTRQAPEASRADRAAMADQWAHEAGQAYRDGDTERAAQLVQAAAAADPARGELWARRTGCAARPRPERTARPRVTRRRRYDGRTQGRRARDGLPAAFRRPGIRGAGAVPARGALHREPREFSISEGWLLDRRP